MNPDCLQSILRAEETDKESMAPAPSEFPV